MTTVMSTGVLPTGSGDALPLLEILTDRLREAIRAEGIDPQRDTAAVRRLAEVVVRGHDERALTGEVASLSDPDRTVGELVARVSGFGPLQRFLDDPEVEEFRSYPRPLQAPASAAERTLMPVAEVARSRWSQPQTTGRAQCDSQCVHDR